MMRALGARSEAARGAAEKGEGGGVFGGGVPWRIEEDDVERGCSVDEPFEDGHRAARFDGEARDDAERAEVGADRGERGRGAFREEDVRGAAAEGLDADGSGAGVEVREAGSQRYVERGC